MAFYGGDQAAARDRLSSARDKWQQLSVSDDSLAALINMGFASSEVRQHLPTS